MSKYIQVKLVAVGDLCSNKNDILHR